MSQENFENLYYSSYLAVELNYNILSYLRGKRSTSLTHYLMPNYACTTITCETNLSTGLASHVHSIEAYVAHIPPCLTLKK